MTERVLTALRGLGIEGTPAAALEREDAFFALLGEMLVYQDAQGTRRVTLRDLTRIHSDQGGLLRVETPAGTALTASLLGFDPAQVQPFFAQVRDATARAKNLPAAPVPTAGGLKTFGSAPRAPIVLGEAAPAPAVTPPAEAPAPGTVTVRPKLPAAQMPAPQTSAPTAPQRSEEPPTPKVGAVNTSAKAVPAAPPQVSPVKAPPAETVPARPGDLLAALAERASAVHALVGRLRLLAVVLGLAAAGLAVIQYLDENPFQGLWTLIAGGVGAIALLIFADVTRLIVTLARAVAGERAAEPARSETARPDASRP
ncbi:hypothetical protein [Deinococcus budaensis]|uniref:Uncharacterized protein n=1 Tax=Deinococcus budaensis TaxID=1665626 RepID=A0A7W8GBX4_9DEIO|nr:hypothetical protein [Deinococcus budaensis]MBB5232678.1 hypothetical protein [Deinococcus budaensis]